MASHARGPWYRMVALATGLGLLSGTWLVRADELKITPNVPIPEFQNRLQDVKPYNFDAPPEGMFRSIQASEDIDEELSFRRTHEMVAVRPSEQFRPDAPAVFIVFQLHQHYQSFTVFGLCFPEAVKGLAPAAVVAQDSMYIATEDESGYLKLTPPASGWYPGRYKVEIHVGEQVNELSLIGTMRFTVVQPASTAGSTTR